MPTIINMLGLDAARVVAMMQTQILNRPTNHLPDDVLHQKLHLARSNANCRIAIRRSHASTAQAMISVKLWRREVDDKSRRNTLPHRFRSRACLHCGVAPGIRRDTTLVCGGPCEPRGGGPPAPGPPGLGPPGPAPGGGGGCWV